MNAEGSADGPAMVPPGSAGSAEDGGLTVAQTATRLGISTDSVRRRLKAGELSGHQRQAKHGLAWCIHPDEPPGSRDGSATVAQGSADEDAATAVESQSEPSAVPALIQAEAMAAYTRSVLEPLVAALERSEGRVAQLERENGQLTGERERAERAELERDTLRAALSDERVARVAAETKHAAILEAQPAPAPVEPPVPFWRLPWPWLALVAVILAGALLVWPR